MNFPWPIQNRMQNLKISLSRFELLRPFLTPQNTLLHRAAWETRWIFAIRFGKRIIFLIQKLILARLLLPKDFGLFGIVLIAASTLGLLNITGFKSALIQKQGERNTHLNTAWTVLVIQGCFSAVLLFLLSGPISAFFGESRAINLIKVFSVCLLLNGFINIGTIYFAKELKFKKQFIFDMIEVLVDVIISISLAIVFCNVWALVAGAVIGKIARLISSFLLHEYRPTFKFDWLSFKELFVFGKWMWLSTFLSFLMLQGDNLFVGKILGATSLGLYIIAYSVGTFSKTAFGNVLISVLFPTYSKLQNNLMQLRKAYLKVTRSLTFLILPITVGIVILTSDFVKLALGDAWISTIPLIQILAVSSMLNVLTDHSKTLFRGKGFPKYATVSEILFLVFAGGLIYPFTILLGLPGVAVAVLCGAFVSWLYSEYVAIKILSIKATEVVKAYSINILSTLLMGILLILLKSIIINSSLLSIIMLPPAGLAIFMLSVFVIDSKFENERISDTVRK